MSRFGLLTFVAAVAPILLPLSGCGQTAGCAGSEQPPEVTVTLDALPWAHAHPSTTLVTACAEPYPCRPIPAKLLTRTRLFVGNVPPGNPPRRYRPVVVRVTVRSGSRTVLRARGQAVPKLVTESGPCGPYDSAYATLTLTGNGQLVRGTLTQ